MQTPPLNQGPFDFSDGLTSVPFDSCALVLLIFIEEMQLVPPLPCLLCGENLLYV